MRALVIVATIIAVAAIGLNASASFLKLNFRKDAVQPRSSIQSIPTRIGSWVSVVEQKLPAEVEDELGTTMYIQRTYIDIAKADDDIREAYEAADVKSEELINSVANSALTNDPFARVSLHVAYYTGSVDTVPHIPDRCMLGAGFEMSRRETVVLPLPAGTSPDIAAEGLPVSFAAFEDPREGANRSVNRVAYFFHVNGDYEHDAITGVRKRLQNLFETHAYFAKIEISSTGPSGLTPDAEAGEAMTRFLSEALPEIEAILPDWQAVMADAKPVE